MASCAPRPASPLASNTGRLLRPWGTKPRLGFHPWGMEGYLPPHQPQGLTLPDSLLGLPTLSLLWGSRGCPVCAAWRESGRAPALSKGSGDPLVLGDPRPWLPLGTTRRGTATPVHRPQRPGPLAASVLCAVSWNDCRGEGSVCGSVSWLRRKQLRDILELVAIPFSREWR